MVTSIEFLNKRSKRFIASIGPHLKSMFTSKDEVIISKGDYANEIYFIKKGVVGIGIKELNNFCFMKISQGYYFGEVDILFGGTRKFSFISQTDCELLWISKKNFTKIFINEFSSIGHEIYRNALRRRVNTFQAFREAVDHCKNLLKENKKIQENIKLDNKIALGFQVNEDKFHDKNNLTKEDLLHLHKIHEVHLFSLLFLQ